MVANNTSKLEKSYFEVLGLCCSSEVPLIEKILKPLEGVNEISVIVPTKTVIVVHDPLLITPTQLVEALNRQRLEANIKLHGETTTEKKWPEKWVICSGILLALSLFKYFYLPLQWLAIGSVAIGLPPLVLKSLAAIRNCSPNVNILMMIAVIGTLALQDYLEAGSIVFLYAISQWLEARASQKAMAVMSSLTNMAPEKATLAGSGMQVNVSEVVTGTILVVKAGEAIPIDGIVVEGQCEVDEKMLTGESFPVWKKLEDTVWAGTISLNGYIELKTTALAEDSVVARMTKLVEDAHKKKSRAERLIDTCAKYYIPAVMLISAGIAIIPVALGAPHKNHWFHLALVVLVSACPCALILCTPVAIFCALSKAATSAILVKGGEFVELLANVKTMAFDKTGTITRGEFVVTHFESLSKDISFNNLLYWVSSIESKSSHPLATALVDYGRAYDIEPATENVEEFMNFPGEGIFGNIDGEDVYIGNHSIANRAGCAVPIFEESFMGGKTSGYVFCGASVVGVFNLSDACRTGAKEAITELKSLGIRTLMLTGDSQAAAKFAQDQLEDALDEIKAELLPEDKAKAIEDLKKQGPVAMIGDGINDALALATADIGISMGISGSALASETGHIILMSNDLKKLPEAIKLARKTKRKLIENIIISVTVKGVILVLAFVGYPLVWAAVLADVGTCLVVILNSMLILQEDATKKSMPKCNTKVESSTNDCYTPLLDTEKIVFPSSSQSGSVEPKKQPSSCGCCKNLKDDTSGKSDESLKEIIIE